MAKALGAAAVVVLMFSGPWLCAGSALVLLGLLPDQSHWWLWLLAVAAVGVALQLALRLWTRREFAVPLSHWWLMGLGGLLVGGIGPTSVIRSLTGVGWTWKGRSLA